MSKEKESSYFSKIFHLTESVRKGGITYEEYASLLESNYSTDTLRKFSYVFSEIFSDLDEKNVNCSDELEDIKEDIIKGTRFCGGYTESGGIKLPRDR